MGYSFARWIGRVAAIAAVCTVSIVACTKNTGADANAGRDTTQVANRGGALVNDATGPAPAVPGAKPGGTITVLLTDDFEHLDPAQVYVNTSQMTGMIIYRTLTALREKPDGSVDVVGDLATNTGVSSDSGRVWKYTLRDGVKYEDGRPITSQDIAYGIARSFSPQLPNGPHYIQQWLAGKLDYNHDYKGPYDGGAPSPPNVETPDPRTIIFHFPEAHPEMPFAAALATSAPVPRDKDTKVQYDNRPFASGPYRIGTYQRTQRLVLVKNPNWDAASDPVRHQYPDTIQFLFGAALVQINERLMSAQGADASALAWQAVSPEVLPQVMADPALKARVLEGTTGFTWFLMINNQRVKDVDVRRALNWAIDRESFLKVYGANAGEVGTTIMSPAVLGYQKYNAYDGGPNGNIDKAKALLHGKTVPLVYAYPNTQRQQALAAFVKSNFEKAGFQVTLHAVAMDQYYTSVGKKDNPYDLYFPGWGPDWPSGATVIPPLFDGRQIAPEGNQNTAYFNEPAVNARIDEISKELDLTKASADWGALDREIMEKYAPTVPVLYAMNSTLSGPKVGGIFLSTAFGIASLVNIYVK